MPEKECIEVVIIGLLSHSIQIEQGHVGIRAEFAVSSTYPIDYTLLSQLKASVEAVTGGTTCEADIASCTHALMYPTLELGGARALHSTLSWIRRGYRPLARPAARLFIRADRATSILLRARVF